MNILDSIVNAQNGSVVQQLGTQLGLSPDKTTAALGAIVPALAAGFQQNAQSAGGLQSLISALSSGQHSQYMNNASMLGNSATVDDGNGILGHVFGSKDISRQVASSAAEQTGIGADVIKKMLPLAAALMMGAMARHAAAPQVAPSGFGGTTQPPAVPGGGGLMDVLGQTISQGQSGSMVNDVVGMLGRFLGR